LDSLIANDARHKHEIKLRIAMAKAANNKKKTVFYQQIGFELKEETGKVLHLEHSFVLC